MLDNKECLYSIPKPRHPHYYMYPRSENTAVPIANSTPLLLLSPFNLSRGMLPSRLIQ